MRVPTAEQSVGIDAINAPQIKAPGAVAGQFGEQVGAALEQAGNEGLQASGALMKHIQQQNYWKGQATIADGALKIRNQFQDMAYSTESIPVNGPPGSAPATQPKGYMNRMGFSANGSTEELIRSAGPIREQYVSQFKGNPRLLTQATERFDTLYNSYFNQVSKHEGNQYRLGMNNTFNAQTVSTMTSTAAANDTASLMTGIDMIKKSTAEQYKFAGQGDDVIQAKAQINIANSVSKAVVNKLTSTGDLAQAQSMLDAAKGEIPADRYEKIASMLSTGSQRIQQQAHVANVQKEISGQATLLGQLSQGKGGWMNLDDMSRLVEQGAVSEKFAKAYSDVIAAKGKYTPRQESNENVPNFIDAIYRAPDQTTLHNTLIKMMQEHKDMSQDQMAILINSALKRSGTLPLDTKFGGGSPDPKQMNIDAGARAVVNFGRRNNLSSDEIGFMYGNYYNKASSGVGVPQAMEQATHQYAINKYPGLATVEGTPHAFVTPDSGVKYLHFNSDTTVAPARVWNPKTGTFDVNTNRAQTTKGDKKP